MHESVLLGTFLSIYLQPPDVFLDLPLLDRYNIGRVKYLQL